VGTGTLAGLLERVRARHPEVRVHELVSLQPPTPRAAAGRLVVPRPDDRPSRRSVPDGSPRTRDLGPVASAPKALPPGAPQQHGAGVTSLRAHPPTADPVTLGQDELELLVLLATCAPSVLNTQPWAFERTPTGLALRADRRRQLAVLDPEGRQLVLACGAALHHLVVAARGLGLDADVHLLPQDGVLASINLVRVRPATKEQQRRSGAILQRHTQRGRMDDAAVPTGVLSSLRTRAGRAGAELRVLRSDELPGVEHLARLAEQELEQRPGRGAERARWVWHGSAEDHLDGVPHGDDDAAARPLVDPALAEQPSAVLLVTQGDDLEDWLRAGTALSDVLLEATLCGLAAQPLGHVTDVPRTRWALRSTLGTAGVPQVLLRLAHGRGGPVTPRRPVADVLSVRLP